MLDATTLNLGRLGALVIAPAAPDSEAIPQPGDAVNLEILLPAHQQFGKRCLSCDAVTVRASSESGGCYIALQFERVEIRKVPATRPAAASVAVM